MPTKAKLEDENKTLNERISLLEEEKKAWIARELRAVEHQERLEDNYKQVIAQKELMLALRAAVLTYERISDTVSKEQVSNLVDLCKIYECLPEGLIEALVELKENTKELEEKLEI